MAHFARIDMNGIVDYVIRIDDQDAPDPAPEHSEPLGRAFIARLAETEPSLEGTWVQTSYNGNFRKKYAWIGDRYDAEADVFISPSPFPSWVLDENYDWRPPVPMPDGDGLYYWDEGSLSWVSPESSG